MQKIALMLLLLFLTILAACGAKEEPLDKSDVLNQASKAVETLDSYSIDMNMKYKVNEMENTVDVKGDITHNPDTMYLEMSTGMSGMSMDFEMYVRDGEGYISMFGQWLKMSQEELGIESFDQLNKEELNKLVQFSDQFEMSEEGDVYILTLSGDSDEYSALLEELVQSSIGALPSDENTEEAIDKIKVNSLELEIHIDKESFIQKKQIVNADIELEETGQTTPMQLEGQFVISNINTLDPIEIPNEVKQNAVSEEELMGGEGGGDGSFGFGEEMSLEEIKQKVNYTLPEISSPPSGYTLTESIFDKSTGTVMLSYEKDLENGFVLSIYQSQEDYGEMPLGESTEQIMIKGHEGTLHDMEEFFILSWEQNGLFLELLGGGPDLSREAFIEIAENIE